MHSDRTGELRLILRFMLIYSPLKTKNELWVLSGMEQKHMRTEQ